MNRDRAKKMLPIVEALANGINIQYDYTDRGWLDIDCIMPNDDPTRYRIKPEPEVIYVNGYVAGARHGFPTKESAINQIAKDHPTSTTLFIAKKFIECE